MLKFPLLSVAVDRVNWLTALRISTVASGTTAPEGSSTVPVTEVELPPDCARNETPSSPINDTNTKRNASLRIDSITPLLQDKDEKSVQKHVWDEWCSKLREEDGCKGKTRAEGVSGMLPAGVPGRSERRPEPAGT